MLKPTELEGHANKTCVGGVLNENLRSGKTELKESVDLKFLLNDFRKINRLVNSRSKKIVHVTFQF